MSQGPDASRQPATTVGSPPPHPATGVRRRESAARAAVEGLRPLGPVVAWVAAVACGWKVWLQADLLDAVLRGAAAWLGTLAVWMLGLSACERCLGTPPPPDAGGHLPASQGDEKPQR